MDWPMSTRENRVPETHMPWNPPPHTVAQGTPRVGGGENGALPARSGRLWSSVLHSFRIDSLTFTLLAVVVQSLSCV